MSISRRSFIKGIIALPLAYHPLLNLVSAAEESDSSTHLKIVKRIPKNKAKSLEKIITRSNPIKDKEKYPTFHAEAFPEIVSRINKTGNYWVDFDFGNALLLDGEGFFIMPAHILQKDLQGSGISDSGDVVYYDAVNGFMKHGEILAYNLHDDIAIGKMEVALPKHPTFHIPGRDIKLGEYLYVLTYDYIEDLQSCVNYLVSSPKKGNNISPEFSDQLNPNIYRTRPLMMQGHFTLKNKLRYDFAVISQEISWDSGSPIYWRNGDLAGILTKQPKKDLTHRIIDEVPVAFAISGKTISRNIRKYLDINKRINQ